MKSEELTRGEMEIKSYELFQDLSDRMERIGRIQNVPIYALFRFEELKEKYQVLPMYMGDKELREFYRDLKYIDNLQTSTVEGAYKTRDKFEPIAEQLRIMSPETRNKFWEIYKHIYADRGGQELYKYELFENIALRMMTGEDPEQIEETIKDLYFRVEKQLAKDKSLRRVGSDATIQYRFSRGLDELL